MPLYVYRCKSCDQVFEDLVSAADARSGLAIACPHCEATDTERELTTFAVRGETPRTEAAPFCGRCGENRPPCGA
jgi:putative FmdB family regulatory protein